VSNFSIFHGVVSLPCEWSWAIRLSAATVVAPYCRELPTVLMQMLFWRKNFVDGNCPSLGIFAAPDIEYPELSLVSYLMVSKNI
jgi:hypothetical protein